MREAEASVMQKLPHLCCLLVIAGCSRAGGFALPAAAPQEAGHPRRGAVRFTTLFSFGGARGKEPYAGLIPVGGAFFGTTYGGGARDDGTVYALRSSGHTVIYSFKGGMDGALPEARLLNVNGTLYGTTINGGGPGDEGVVFATRRTGGESVVHRFTGGADGANPYAGLSSLGGHLYGTTAGGGTHSQGTVFEITPPRKERVLYSFGANGADGSTPVARAIALGGVLYGTTSFGGRGCGTRGCGTVYKITASGTETVLYAFKGGRYGSRPSAALTVSNGTLYGTTAIGGSANAGTVFSMTPSGRERLLYSFKGRSDGAGPQELTSIRGVLYGTTAAGGSRDDGTIFSITPSGRESVLYTFTGGSDGAAPRGGLLGLSGTLYGTASAGGAHGAGTVFSFTP